jgi:hypothetical protein
MKDILNLIFILIIGFLGLKYYQALKEIDEKNIKIEKQEENNMYTSIMYDEKIENLKKVNKELYDSLKFCEEQIDYLINFKYQKEYIIDTIYCDTTSLKETNVFTYTNQPNDTLQYVLNIGSKMEPAWYKLKFDVTEEFTIVNKKDGDKNETNILPKNGGNIIDATIINAKTKKTFFERFRIEPSLTMGYSLINNNIDLIIGASLIYDIK